MPRRECFRQRHKVVPPGPGGCLLLFMKHTHTQLGITFLTAAFMFKRHYSSVSFQKFSACQFWQTLCLNIYMASSHHHQHAALMGITCKACSLLDTVYCSTWSQQILSESHVSVLSHFVCYQNSFWFFFTSSASGFSHSFSGTNAIRKYNLRWLHKKSEKVHIWRRLVAESNTQWTSTPKTWVPFET